MTKWDRLLLIGWLAALSLSSSAVGFGCCSAALQLQLAAGWWLLVFAMHCHVSVLDAVVLALSVSIGTCWLLLGVLLGLKKLSNCSTSSFSFSDMAFFAIFRAGASCTAEIMSILSPRGFPYLHSFQVYLLPFIIFWSIAFACFIFVNC